MFLLAFTFQSGLKMQIYLVNKFGPGLRATWHEMQMYIKGKEPRLTHVLHISAAENIISLVLGLHYAAGHLCRNYLCMPFTNNSRCRHRRHTQLKFLLGLIQFDCMQNTDRIK